MELTIQLETISREMIKPSKPTSQNLKSYKLSLLDQVLSLLEYSSPMVFFFTKYEVESYGSDTIITRLKDSLSNTLSLYYPLAGRLIIKDSAINCNDEGIPLVVTRVINSTLFRLLAFPNRVNLIPRFIPSDVMFLNPTRIESDGLIPVAFQISVFSCGGFAIGSHVISKVLDGISWAHFLMTWTVIAKGGRLPHVVSPTDLIAQIRVFPPVSDRCLAPAGIPLVLQPIEGSGSGSRCVVKTFEFSQASICELQAFARNETVANPTRVESVTGFLWKHLMAASSRNVGN